MYTGHRTLVPAHACGTVDGPGRVHRGFRISHWVAQSHVGGVNVCGMRVAVVYCANNALLGEQSPSELLASPSELSASPIELLASPSELLASPSEL
jgi:hypothetical protein